MLIANILSEMCMFFSVMSYIYAYLWVKLVMLFKCRLLLMQHQVGTLFHYLFFLLPQASRVLKIVLSIFYTISAVLLLTKSKFSFPFLLFVISACFCSCLFLLFPIMCNVDQSNHCRYQNADWRLRPLPEEMLR